MRFCYTFSCNRRYILYFSYDKQEVRVAFPNKTNKQKTQPHEDRCFDVNIKNEMRFCVMMIFCINQKKKHVKIKAYNVSADDQVN